VHPEMLRLINDQRGRELQTRAHQATPRRALTSARRGRGLAVDDEFVCPPIPDDVHGSFRTESTGALSADGHAPTAQHAA